LATAAGLSSSQALTVNNAVATYINSSPCDAAGFAFALIGGDLTTATSILNNDWDCGMISDDVFDTLGSAINGTMGAC